MTNIATQDKVFFTEIALGIVTTTRSIVMRDLSKQDSGKNDVINSALFEDAMKMLDKANSQIYGGNVSPGFLKKLVIFVNGNRNYAELCSAASDLVSHKN